MQMAGKYLLVAGIVIALAGLILWLFGNKLSWLGNLPGDIRIERENTRIYIPISTMLLLSVLASLLMWLIRKLF